MLIKTVPLTGAATNDSHMVMHNPMSNTHISLARELIYFQTQHVHMVLFITEKKGNELVIVNGQIVSIMFSTENIYNANK